MGNDIMAMFERLAQLMPKRTVAPCEVHIDHSPRTTFQEIHHIIPRAWQAFWQPEMPPHPGRADGQQLWDSRTIAVCRTGHGNIHFWIVAMMKVYKPELTVLEVATKVRVQYAAHVGHNDYAWAIQALERYQRVGGDLAALIHAGQYGAI